MRKFSVIFFIAAFAVLFISIEGCSPNSTIPITPLKTGEVTATISGLGSFYSTNAFADSSSNVTYHMRATIPGATTDSIVIDVVVTKKFPVGYTVDVSNDNFSSISYCIVQKDGTCKNYKAQNGSGSGSIRVTDISPTFQGSFSGTLQLVGGTETVSISGGGFNAAWQ